jgi:hypothetical protein
MPRRQLERMSPTRTPNCNPRHHARATWLRCCALLVSLAGQIGVSQATAHAQHAGIELKRVAALSADPNTPTFGLALRGTLRAQLGASLPLWASPESEGFIFTLSPLIELHEPAKSTQVLPSQYWRGHVALAGGWLFGADSATYYIGLALEHESDHETAHAYSTPGFLTLNALALRSLGSFVAGDFALSMAPSVRLYVASCTLDRSACKNFQGATSGGAQLDLVLSAPGIGLWELVPFLSASGFGILRHDSVRSELHLELHLGLAYTTRFLLMQLFALSYLGNDVGIRRSEHVTQLGVGTRLTL